MKVDAMAKEQREQITVKLDPELLAAVERTAAEEHRTISGQVRHFVAKALAEQGAGRAAA
jgi:hypothetical protein